MTLPRPLIEHAAFWHEHICLDCGERQDVPEPNGAACRECGSPNLIAADLLLRAHDFVEKENDE